MLAFFFFFFNDTATTEIYTLSLHDALPIYQQRRRGVEIRDRGPLGVGARAAQCHAERDRKSTRLNSSHVRISYAVFCLKKKKKIKRDVAHVAKHAPGSAQQRGTLVLKNRPP